MPINRGVPGSTHIHARNFTHKQAAQRLQEAIPAIQETGLNALQVDAYEVLLFRKVFSTEVCTCRQSNLVTREEDEGFSGSVEEPSFGGLIAQQNELTIDWGASAFGEPNDHTNNEDDFNELSSNADGYEFDDGQQLPGMDSPVSTALDETPACGICYRHGFVPGYEQYGQQRTLLTTTDVTSIDGYTINRTYFPHKFERLSDDGYVQFELSVPKYFKSASYSVRNNFEVLEDKLYLNGIPLSLAALKDAAGTTILISCTSDEFTHVHFVFDVGAEPIKANIAMLSKMTDWQQFEAIGTLNVVTHTDLSDLPVGSVFIVPKRNIGLRTTDVPILRTASGQSLDWSVNTRYMQPQEQLKNIHKAFKVY